jgi:DNA repair exonuclease SbcCD ATPase subunit
MTATEVEVEAAEVTEVVEEQTAVDTDATTRTAVYKYHCCTVPQNVQRAWDAHFRMANIYYNRMVDVFQASLDRYRELRRKHSPEIEKLDKEYAELQELKSTQTQQMSELRAEQYKLKKRKTDVTTELVKVTQDISQLREAMKERAASSATCPATSPTP